jgi:MEMO1 family protein
VWLRHLLGDKLDGISVVPILGSTFQEFIDEDKDPWADERVGGFLSTLTELMGARRTLWIAGADLAHVGPRYGDMVELSKEDKESLERRDMVTLEHVKKGDPTGWFRSIRAERDRRRVCGLTPIYGVLAAARPGEGRLAVYAQCPAESNSIVSIATVIYPGAPADIDTSKSS